MKKDTLLFYWGSVRSITAHLKNPLGNDWALHHGGLSTHQFTVGVDEVAIHRFNGYAIVAVNGSDNDRYEWRENFNAYPIKKNMHNGFRSAAVDVLNVVIPMLGEPVPTIVVGHSRGGSIAQAMCALAPYSMQCVTFGSPRVFTAAARPTFAHHMVHCKQDPVCHVPPAFIPPFWKAYKTSETVIDIGKGKRGIKQSHVNYGQSIIRWIKEGDNEAK